jgi:hypothetical protein
MSRPSEYTQEIADEICQRIAGGENLRQICAEDELPSERTIYRWLAAESTFCQQYAHARKAWADAQIEEVIAVSKDDQLKADDKRVQIDTLKWAMGKLNGKYSDKVKHVGGDEGDNPIAFTGWDISFGT